MQRLTSWVFILALGLSFSSLSYAAKPEIEADKAIKSSSLGWTVYIDVNFGMRKRMAVTEINEMHAAMSKAGYEPVSVIDHSENGDLVGYIVTYKKR